MILFYILDLSSEINKFQNIYDIKNFCYLSKSNYEKCSKFSFWKKIYETNNLEIPKIKMQDPNDWFEDFEKKIYLEQLIREQVDFLIDMLLDSDLEIFVFVQDILNPEIFKFNEDIYYWLQEFNDKFNIKNIKYLYDNFYYLKDIENNFELPETYIINIINDLDENGNDVFSIAFDSISMWSDIKKSTNLESEYFTLDFPMDSYSNKNSINEISNILYTLIKNYIPISYLNQEDGFNFHKKLSFSDILQ